MGRQDPRPSLAYSFRPQDLRPSCCLCLALPLAPWMADSFLLSDLD